MTFFEEEFAKLAKHLASGDKHLVVSIPKGEGAPPAEEDIKEQVRCFWGDPDGPMIKTVTDRTLTPENAPNIRFRPRII